MRSKFIRLYVLVLVCLFYAGIFAAKAQILGYPVPGGTEYPDRDGRINNRFIPNNDRAFKVVVTDESTGTAYLASDNLNIPYIVRFDLLSFSKRDRLILDNGLSSIRSGWFDVERRQIWFGTQGYLIVIDADRFEVIRFVPAGDYSIEKLFWNPVTDKIMALARGEPDGLLQIDPEDYTIAVTPFESFTNAFSDAVICSNNEHLVIMAKAHQSKILILSLEWLDVLEEIDVDAEQPPTAIALNDPRNELYIAVTGNPSRILRYNFPELELTGTIDLPLDERPRNFMFCDEQGNYLYVNDGDSSSGLIRINTLLFQRLDRLDYGDLRYPVCYAGFEDSIIVATENTPGAVLIVNPGMFQVMDHHEFEECATAADIVFHSPEAGMAFVSVRNLGVRRLTGFDPISNQQKKYIDLPSVTGSIIAVQENEGIAYLLECASEAYIISVNCVTGVMIDRQSFAEGITCLDMVFCPETASLFVLSTENIYEIDTDTLLVTDSIDLDADLRPATGFTLNAGDASLFVGGRWNSGKVWRYLTGPLMFANTVNLEENDNQALFLLTDNEASESYWAVRAIPFRMRCYDMVSETFTREASFPYPGNQTHGMWFSGHLNHILLLQQDTPNRLHRLQSDTLEWLAPLEFQRGTTIVNANAMKDMPYVLFSAAGICSTVVRYGSTQACSIHGSSAELGETSIVESLNIFSHEAGNRIRLAIYDSEYSLRWQSECVENTVVNSWLQVYIHQGLPNQLVLEPGQYFLMFQVTGDGNTPSVTRSGAGTGIQANWPYGSFPSHLVTFEETDAIWSLYANVLPIEPTPTSTPENTPTWTPVNTSTPTPDITGTPEPDDTPTPTMTPTPTATATVMPTHTSTPDLTPTVTCTPVPSMTPTPRPGSGVELTLSQDTFYPGDIFLLNARTANAEPSPKNVELYVILDVYGSYWFGPSWSQSIDFYLINGLLGVRTQEIFHFEWPDTGSSAENIIFWGGMICQNDHSLFGYIDSIQFDYMDNPHTPSPTPTPTTGTPTVTPTEPDTTDSIDVDFATDDPMYYTGENCEFPDIFCFTPERINFCSAWFDIVWLTNTGNSVATVFLGLGGNDPDSFDIENDYVNLEPGETRAVRVRFCPKSPPDNLKVSTVNVEWNGGNAVTTLKGWGVAG